MGLSKTDANGTARLSLAFGLPDGIYSMKAHHKANENFGESENVTNVEIYSNATIESMEWASNPGLSFTNMSLSSIGNLTLEVSSYSPYALLPMNASVKYAVDVPLGGVWVFAVFFLDDYVINGGLFLGAIVWHVNDPQPFEGGLIWTPSVIGFHKLIVGIANGTMLDLPKAIRGEGLRASTEVSLDIQRCPSNIVLDYPEALSGDILPIAAAVSKPRPYQAVSAEFYSAVTLAPRFTYNGVEYVIDERVNSVLVNLFVNSTLTFANQTDESGLVHFQLELDSSQVYFTLNITVVVDDASLLSENVLKRFVSFTRVSVSDVPSAGSTLFNVTYTVNGLAGGGELYVGVENPMRAEVSLFDQPVWNVSVSILSAKLVSRLKAKMFGSASYIPSGSDYLRVVFFYNHTAVASDINDDGEVDIRDLSIVSRAFGSYPGHPRWNPDADLDGDNEVNIRDIAVIPKNFGATDVYSFYYPPQRVYLVFDSGQTVYVDSQGCARIPAGAANFTVWKDGQVVGAFVEFFRMTLDTTSWTDVLGRVAETWAPSEVGTYLVQVKLSSTFSVVLSSFSGVSSVEAPVNLVGYFEVVKRPIDLSVSYSPTQPTLDDEVEMIANVFDLGLGEPADGLLVNFHVYNWTSGRGVYMGLSYTNSSGVATFVWRPRDWLESLGGFAYFVLGVSVPETADRRAL